MRSLTKFVMKFLPVLCLLGAFAFGQADGIPTFGAAESHEVDTINLATVTPVLNVSVMSKPGAIPFSYTASAAQGCSLTSAKVLDCSASDRFTNYVPGMLGAQFNYTIVTQITCNGVQRNSYSGWQLSTSDGLGAHPINPATAYDGYCNNWFTAPTTDGSGYSIQVTSGSFANPVFTVTAPSGLTYSSTTGQVSDPFGNTLSGAGPGLINTTVTDTLGGNIISSDSQYGTHTPTPTGNTPTPTGVTSRLSLLSVLR
jgi:hypothetical protein